MTKQQSKSDPDQYTKPELRDHIKEEVIAGDKGGQPGQWSARKAQLVAHEYEAEGGGYKHPRTETQKSLQSWGEEHWTTSDGKPARREGGTTRYLPEKAWEELTPGNKAATNKKKKTASREGKQFVANTQAAAAARKDVTSKTARKKKAAPKAAKKDAAPRRGKQGAARS